MYGKIDNPDTGKGAYKEDYPTLAVSPTFRREKLIDIWNKNYELNPSMFCLLNGAFFTDKPEPIELSFPLKQNGVIISTGGGEKEYPGTDEKKMLEICEEQLNITDLSPEALFSSSAPDIIAGLDEKVNKNTLNSICRTFIGINDKNGDGEFEILLIFSSQYATQLHAADTLRSFGATKVMMLDGGGSTQLICQGESFISSTRTIPQSLAIIS